MFFIYLFGAFLKKRMFSNVRIFVLRGPSDGFVFEYSHDLIANISAPHMRSLIAEISGV